MIERFTGSLHSHVFQARVWDDFTWRLTVGIAVNTAHDYDDRYRDLHLAVENTLRGINNSDPDVRFAMSRGGGHELGWASVWDPSQLKIRTLVKSLLVHYTARLRRSSNMIELCYHRTTSA